MDPRAPARMIHDISRIPFPSGRPREAVRHLTLASSEDIRRWFFAEVEARYTRTMLAAYQRNDVETLGSLERSRDRLISAFTAEKRQPWRICRSDDLLHGVDDGATRTERRVRVTLRCDPDCAMLYRFGSTRTELEPLQAEVEAQATAAGADLFDLLRDPALGLMAFPGANDFTRLRHAWASDARALLVVAMMPQGLGRGRIVALDEGENVLHVRSAPDVE